MDNFRIELAEKMTVSYTGPANVKLIYVPNGGRRNEPPYEDLDPGIRETVRMLFEAGFNPTDSGDGVSKVGNLGCALDHPHVFMLVEAGLLETETVRLHQLIEAKGITLFNGPSNPAEAEELGVSWADVPDGSIRGYITGRASPGQPNFLELVGVNDQMLV